MKDGNMANKPARTTYASLPAEITRKIIEASVTLNETIVVIDHNWMPRRNDLGLLHVNRTHYKIGIKAYYKKNEFFVAMIEEDDQCVQCATPLHYWQIPYNAKKFVERLVIQPAMPQPLIFTGDYCLCDIVISFQRLRVLGFDCRWLIIPAKFNTEPMEETEPHDFLVEMLKDRVLDGPARVYYLTPPLGARINSPLTVEDHEREGLSDAQIRQESALRIDTHRDLLGRAMRYEQLFELRSSFPLF